MVSFCWWAAFRSIRRGGVSRFGGPLGRCWPCRTARSARGGTGSAAFTIRCCRAPGARDVQRPAPGNGVERLAPRNAAEAWWFRVKAGVERGALRRSRLAARIRATPSTLFRVQDDAGEGRVAAAPALPGVAAVRSTACCRREFFPTSEIATKVRPGYEAATRAEIATIVEQDPDKDLAIQWDCSTEVQDAYGAHPGFPLEGAIERNLTQFAHSAPPSPGRRARLSFLLRHARRLAALPAPARPRPGRQARQRDSWRLRPPRRLDLHSGARRMPTTPSSPRLQNLKPAGRARLSRRHPQHGRLQTTHRDRAQISARFRSRRLLRLRTAAEIRTPAHPRRSFAGARRSRPGTDKRKRRPPRRAPPRPRRSRVNAVSTPLFRPNLG